jgi:serine/threonine protein kinase
MNHPIFLNMASKAKTINAVNPPLDVIERLGEGAMGEALLCHDPSLDRPVVIKRIRTELLHSEDAIVRFNREVQVLAAMKHPNIVEVYGYWSENGYVMMSMEYINGWTLDQLNKIVLKRYGRYPTWVVLGIFWDSLAALSYAHATYAHKHLGQIVHRDLKPANMILGFNGRTTLLDFGISRHNHHPSASPDTVLNLTGQLSLGTIAYMSPEQAEATQVTTASDIFSLGIIVWELLTGKHPFRSDNAISTLTNTTKKELLASQLPSDCPSDLANLVLDMLRKDPRRRPSAEVCMERLAGTYASLPRDLSPYLGAFLHHARKPESIPIPQVPRLVPKLGSRWKWIAAGCVSGFFLGLILGKLA